MHRVLGRTTVAVAAIAVFAVATAAVVTQQTAAPWPPVPARQVTYSETLSETDVEVIAYVDPATGDSYIVPWDPQYGDQADVAVISSTDDWLHTVGENDVIRLYAQPFPFDKPAALVKSLTLDWLVDSFKFRVSPPVTTRYQVKFFGTGRGPTPTAVSEILTVYVRATFAPPGQ